MQEGALDEIIVRSLL